MAARRTPRQQDLAFPAGWGGRRKGAGRKPGPNPKIRHRSREPFHPKHPVHVTFSFALGRRSLRTCKALSAFRELLRALHAARTDFRVVAFSLQRNHLHLIAEADSRKSFASGIQSIAVRMARRLNKALERKGPIFADRHHRRSLTTPREVRNALRYVLLNHRRHRKQQGWKQRNPSVDPFSSGGWFDGWTTRVWVEKLPPAVARAKTWLARLGWKKHGLISPDEIPGGRRPSPQRC